MPERLSALVHDKLDDQQIVSDNWLGTWLRGPIFRGRIWRGLALAAAVGLQTPTPSL